jgi:hypothetical protein
LLKDENAAAFHRIDIGSHPPPFFATGQTKKHRNAIADFGDAPTFFRHGSAQASKGIGVMSQGSFKRSREMI